VPAEYLENLRKSVVFLVRPQRALLGVGDSVRAVVTWENQVRIDETIGTLLQMWDVKYVPIEMLGAAERRALVDWCLEARGFRRVE